VDFPIVGQREYRAKQNREAVGSHNYAPSPARSEPEPKKKGFFERFTGRGKRDSDSQLSTRQQGATPARKTPDDASSYAVGGNARDLRNGWMDGEQNHQEKPELPVFFNKSRR
jgi:hypothetical protein